MTREILLHNLNIDNPRQLPYRLDAVAILHQLNGVEYIKDLDPELLDNIKRATGTENGFEITAGSIRFIVNSLARNIYDPVLSFVLNFNIQNGDFTGISDIIYLRDLTAKEKIVEASHEEQTSGFRQIKSSIERFADNLSSCGLLNRI